MFSQNRRTIRKMSSADSLSWVTCMLRVPGLEIVWTKNLAAMYVVTPTCRAFSTTFLFAFSFKHTPEYSCCARFSLNNARLVVLVRIFNHVSMKKSRSVGSLPTSTLRRSSRCCPSHSR